MALLPTTSKRREFGNDEAARIVDERRPID
jgi:hypothetical protein